MSKNQPSAPVLLDTELSIERTDPRELARRPPTFANIAQTAALVLNTELCLLKQQADGGLMDKDSSERLARSIKGLCALSKEQRETLEEQRRHGQGLATAEALRELLDNPEFRALVKRLLLERASQGLDV